MKRVLTPALPTRERAVQLPEAEAEHLTRVLRLRDGDVLQALDGRGHAAIVTLRIKDGGPRIEFLESPVSMNSQSIPPLRLEMAILKGDAMEWIVEKAVELGVRELVPTVTAHTVVQIKNKGPEAFRDRWQKIADQALKQCGRLEKMEVALPIALEDLLARSPADASRPRLWFDEAGREQLPYLENWLSTQTLEQLSELRLLVGPEGGWSDSERELLNASSRTSPIHRLGLGPWVLRAETAAIFSISLASSRFRAANFLDKNATKKGS